MKPNSIYYRYPSEQLQRTFIMLAVSTPSFIRCYQDVFLNHTHGPHAAFHLKPKEKTDQRLPCERERMPRSFCRLSRSLNGLATCPSPSRASWAPLTPMRAGR